MSGEPQWLFVVGIGEDGYEGLKEEAKQAISSAEFLYGGARHLELVPASESSAVRICWPSPMSVAVQQILEQRRGRSRVAVLASGDPMLHGVGVSLTRSLPASEFRVIPQVSAFSLACARLGWPMADTMLVSLVNRPVEGVLRYMYPGQRLVAYSEDGRTPAAIARSMTEAGFGRSTMHVFESLGGPAERHSVGVAEGWQIAACGKLNLVAVSCSEDAAASAFSGAPGLPEGAFENDGQITKREVRAVTVARLAPMPHQTLWDVGAGSGSVGIEWMRAEASCSCIAFEARRERADRIVRNSRRLGVPELRVIEGRAPQSFEGLNRPNAIFLGGDVSNDELFGACWAKLLPRGRLVANAVTLEGEAKLIARHAAFGGELVRIGVARADAVGAVQGWRPMMPITQWAVEKP